MLRDAGDLDVTALARRIDDLSNRARAGSVSPGECSGARFTLLDTGARGVLVDLPALVPGQVATLVAGPVAERPVVVASADGQRGIAVRSMVTSHCPTTPGSSTTASPRGLSTSFATGWMPAMPAAGLR